jgi:Ran GTPase-activating protein (RanGAP) involved in mRNA processing and transport
MMCSNVSKSSDSFLYGNSQLGNSPNNIVNGSIPDPVKMTTQKMNTLKRKRFENEDLQASIDCNHSGLKNSGYITILGGTKRHRMLFEDLKKQSIVFNKMFSRDDWKESRTEELKITSEAVKNREVIDQFIQCLTTGESQCMNERNFQDLLSLAYQYEVWWLRKDCEQFVVLNLALDNVLSVIHDIAEPYGRSDLLRNCFIYLFKNRNSLNKDFMKEIQALGEKLGLVELKILAAQTLKPYVSLSKNSSYLFDIDMSGRDFARNVRLLIQIFSGEPTNKCSVNLRIYGLSNHSALAEFLEFSPKMACLGLGWSGPEGAIQIASTLKRNTTLTRLDLSNNKIGDAVATQIAAALKGNTILRRLGLGCNEIRDEGVRQIASALKENTTLTSLDLEQIGIGDKGVSQIAEILKENTTLIRLNLGGNKIRGEGGIQIASALKKNKTLTHLRLQKNNINGEAAIQIASALKENTTLTRLDLGENNIGNKGACQIASALKKNTTLTSLNLEQIGIGNKGARQIALALKENTTLTSLGLKHNEIGRGGIRQIASALKENTTLANLNLGFNKIGYEGSRLIAAVLKKNTALTKLNLGGNGIEYVGVIQIAAALRENTTLRSLNLRCNKFGNEGARRITSANTTLTSLKLSGE